MIFTFTVDALKEIKTYFLLKYFPIFIILKF